MISRARQLRQQPTSAEIRLWRLLYPFRTGGFHFRKQAPIGPYVADFACHHASLIIEVDGDTHASAAAIAADKRRDEFFQGEGYRILRFTNRDVLEKPEAVFDLIKASLIGFSAGNRKRQAGGLK